MATRRSETLCSLIHPFVCDKDIEHDELIHPVMSFVRSAYNNCTSACCNRSKMFLQQCYRLDNFSNMSRNKMNKWIINQAIKKFKESPRCLIDLATTEVTNEETTLPATDISSPVQPSVPPISTDQPKSSSSQSIQTVASSCSVDPIKHDEITHDFQGIFRSAQLHSFHDDIIKAKMQQGTGVFTLQKTSPSLSRLYEYTCKTKGCRCRRKITMHEFTNAFVVWNVGQHNHDVKSYGQLLDENTIVPLPLDMKSDIENLLWEPVGRDRSPKEIARIICSMDNYKSKEYLSTNNRRIKVMKKIKLFVRNERDRKKHLLDKIITVKDLMSFKKQHKLVIPSSKKYVATNI